MYGTSYTKLQCAVSKTMIHSMQNCGMWYAKLWYVVCKTTVHITQANYQSYYRKSQLYYSKSQKSKRL